MTLLDLLLSLLIGTAMAASPVDGDTIKVDGTVYRLSALDAPEKRQTCGGYQAGTEATNTLSGLIQGREVACEPRGQDRYGRTIAICRADGQDLGRILVRSGLAFAYRKYSLDYVPDEAMARAEHLGIWRHECIPPWEWRHR